MRSRSLSLVLLVIPLLLSCGKEVTNPLYGSWQTETMRAFTGNKAAIKFTDDSMAVEGAQALPGGAITVSASLPIKIEGDTIEVLAARGKAKTRNAAGQVKEIDIDPNWFPIAPGKKAKYLVQNNELHITPDGGKVWVLKRSP